MISFFEIAQQRSVNVAFRSAEQLGPVSVSAVDIFKFGQAIGTSFKHPDDLNHIPLRRKKFSLCGWWTALLHSPVLPPVSGRGGQRQTHALEPLPDRPKATGIRSYRFWR